MAEKTDRKVDTSNVHDDDSTSREVMDNPLKSTEHVSTGPGDPSRPPFRSGLIWGVAAVILFAIILLIAL